MPAAPASAPLHALPRPRTTGRIPPVRGRSLPELLAPQGRRRQALPGFDRSFADIVDYIVRITHRIWDERMIGEIRRFYAPDCPVVTLGGPVAGAEAVIDGTIRTLAEFPDRTMLPEAVIWSGDGRRGFVTSHRILSEATHRGCGAFGPPTGRQIRFRTIADCLVHSNRIVAEWLARDTSGMALGLGLEPAALAAATPPTEATRRWWQERLAALRAAPAPKPPPAAAAGDRALAPPALARNLLGTLLGGTESPAPATALYHEDARLNAPGGRALSGAAAAAGWWAELQELLGDISLSLDHAAANPAGPDPEAGCELAARWWLAGRHCGSGRWGPASGRDLLILGISHWLVRDGRIAEETTLFDELALLRQIAAPVP